MPDFLVETYEPRPDPRHRAALLKARGYAHSIHVPGDEMSLHLFEGVSLDELRAVLSQAEIAHSRIVEARR